MGAPDVQWSAGGIVIREVVRWDLGVDTTLDVALVLELEGIGIVLGMAKHKEATAIDRLYNVEAHLVRHGNDLKVVHSFNVFDPYIGITRMDCIEAIVKAPHERTFRLEQAMLENARCLFGQAILLDAVVVIQARLRAPADMQRRMHVRTRPVHDATQLIPVVHLFELHELNGGPGNNQAIVMLVFDVLEGAVERLQVSRRHMRCLVALGAQQVNLNLQRRIGELAHKLRLGGDLGGHEVQNQHAQRTNILVESAKLRHDKDVLALENLGCGQSIRNSNRHDAYTPSLTHSAARATLVLIVP